MDIGGGKNTKYMVLFCYQDYHVFGPISIQKSSVFQCNSFYLGAGNTKINPLGRVLKSNIFIIISPLLNRISQGHKIVRECSPPSMCQMSHVTCHMSYITCHMSHVKFCVSLVKKNIYILLFFFIQQCGGVSWWRVCYQQGLPLSSLFWCCSQY